MFPFSNVLVNVYIHVHSVQNYMAVESTFYHFPHLDKYYIYIYDGPDSVFLDTVNTLISWSLSCVFLDTVNTLLAGPYPMCFWSTQTILINSYYDDPYNPALLIPIGCVILTSQCAGKQRTIKSTYSVM